MAVELPCGRFADIVPLLERTVVGRARAEAALLRPQSRLFVDNAIDPSLMLLCMHRDDIWLLAGSAEPGAVCDLIEHVASIVCARGERFVFRPADPVLDDFARSAFGCRVCPTRVLAYDLDPAATPHVRSWRRRVAADCEVVRVDGDLMRRIDKSVDVDFHDLWPDPEEFVAQGVAFCLLWSGRPASIAWSYGPPGTTLELAVGTAPDARGRGFCTLAASALLEYCLDRAITPIWMTWEANKASQAVAARLGFTNPIWHHWLTWTPFNAHRQAAPLPASILGQYTGRYRTGSIENEIRLFPDGRLMLINEHNQWHLLDAEDESRLFFRGLDIQMEAQRDPAGRLSGLRRFQAGREYHMERCPAPTEPAPGAAG